MYVRGNLDTEILDRTLGFRELTININYVVSNAYKN